MRFSITFLQAFAYETCNFRQISNKRKVILIDFNIQNDMKIMLNCNLNKKNVLLCFLSLCNQFYKWKAFKIYAFKALQTLLKSIGN